MTAEDIEDAIQFDQRDASWGFVMVRARLIINIDGMCEVLDRGRAHQDAMERVKADLSRKLMAELFQDKRCALYRAIQDLLQAMPNPAQQDAIDRIMKLARYQPPQDYEDK